MKTVHFILPVVALLSVAAWIASQRQSIASLEDETATLRQHIAAARSDNGSGHSPALATTSDKSKSAKKSLDWEKLAAWADGMESGSGMGDIGAVMRFQQQIQEMSKDEILAALQKIAALDLPESSRQRLEFMFLGPLIEKDPEYALNAYIDRLGTSNHGFDYQLSTALGEWAKKDPAAATAWFDRQVVEGKFESKSLDGKNGPRIIFEASLLEGLFADDSAGMEHRIASYPDDQRLDLIKQVNISLMDPARRKSYVEMVRGQISPGDLPETIAHMASRLAYQGDYGTLSNFLSDINAGPDERAVTVEEAGQARLQITAHIKKIGREDVDAMRVWAATQSPGTADTATGKILGNLALHGNPFKFEDAAAMAVGYHEGGAGDDLLVSFLGSQVARQNPDQAAQLAGKIIDPILREETLLKLSKKR